MTQPDLGVSSEFDLGSVTITYEMCIQNNGTRPGFHNSREVAALQGFPEAVVAGPHLITICSEALAGVFGKNWIEGGKISLEFVKPVLALETIRLAAKVADRIRRPDNKTLVQLDLLGLGPNADDVRFVGSASAYDPS